MIPAHIKALGIEACRLYQNAIDNGATEAFADMVAHQIPPGTKGSDRAFMEGRLSGNWMDGMPKAAAQRMVRQARAAGINTTGKFYMGGLADKRAHLDPHAWVDSVADVKRVAKARDLEVRGIVDYTPPERPPKKSVGIAPDILNKAVKAEMEKNPGARKADVVDRVKDRITPHWKKRK